MIHRFLKIFFYSLFLIIYTQALAQDVINNIAHSTVVIRVFDRTDSLRVQGNGFFLNDREAVTNWHVVVGASRAEVLTDEGKSYAVKKILAEDKENDLLLLEIDNPTDSFINLKVSCLLPEKNERVKVIGRDLKNRLRVNDGYVIGISEHLDLGQVIQISAEIYPGLSGSPVINEKGEVIGVATCRKKEKGEWQYFATIGNKINNLKKTVDQVLAEWSSGRAGIAFFKAKELYDKGLNLIYSEKYRDALTYLKKAIERDPDFVQAYVEIGFCNDKLGYNQAAIRAYQDALKIKPDYASALNGLALAFIKIKRYQDGGEVLKRLTVLRPNYYEAHYNLGVINDKINRLEDAIAAYQQAVRIKPDYFEAYNGLGITYTKLGRYREAIESFHRALTIKPGIPEVYYGLGLAYIKVGSYDDAIEAFDKIRDIKDMRFDVYNGLGIAYTNLNRHQEAIESFKNAIKLKPDRAELYFNLGLNYGGLGQYAKEIEAYEKAIAINPSFTDAYFNLAITYNRLGRYQEAIESFKQVIRLSPGMAEAYYGLGVVYLKLEKTDEALVAFKKTVQLNPNHINGHFNLGIIYFNLGDSLSAWNQYEVLKNLDKPMAAELYNIFNFKK